MKYPIYIPSTGRAHLQRTVKLLEANGIKNYFVIVETKEITEYEKAVGVMKVLALPKSNYGTSTNARNFAIEHSTKNGYAKHWQMDDDISYVMEHEHGKPIHTNLKRILEEMENFSDALPRRGMVGMRTMNFLKDVNTTLTFSTSLTSLYLLTNIPSIRFRGIMYVDMDYCLQCLRKGYSTVRFDKFAFKFITPLTTKGGYHDVYADDKKRMEAIEQFLKYNPDVDPTIKRSSTGYLQLANIKAIWRKFKTK